MSFVKSPRLVKVKYDHTPVHKTVAQLMEALAPEPAPPPTPEPKMKTPKAPKPPREPKHKTPRSSKKRTADGDAAEGEGPQPKKKKRRKKDSVAAPTPDGAVVPPEMPNALPVGDQFERQLYNTQQPDGMDGGGTGSYPEGLVGSSAAAGYDTDTWSESQGAASANGGVHSHSTLNLPLGEAARRRDVALQLLAQGQIDPQSLSAEQFNIFANQSPELQKESLAMLIEYGAERLRIVHPSKDGASSGQTGAAPGQREEATGSVSTEDQSQASAPPVSAEKRRSTRSEQTDAGGLEEPGSTGDAETSAIAPGVVSAVGKKARLTRGACDCCRLVKEKVSHGAGGSCVSFDEANPSEIVR